MRLGFAVKVLGEAGLPSHDARRWQSGPHLRTSLGRLRAILHYLDRHDIRMYRMATALAPYASHPELTPFHGQIEECGSELAEIGALARELDIRLSTHPGQYTVLNSERPEVRRAAVADLEVQAALLDAMGLGPEAVVVLHVGGAAGGHPAAADRFLAGFEQLSERARARLAIENDDRLFALRDVVALAERTGLRVVFDVHHHHCHDPDRIDDRDQGPLLLAAARRRGEADAPARRPDRPIAFERFIRHSAGGVDFDVMLEAKAKDLALLGLREQLAARGIPLEAWRPLEAR